MSRVLWEMVRKDLLILLRDRRTFVLLLVMPMVFIAVLGFTTGQLLTGRSREILRLVLVDQDRGPLAQRLAADLRRDTRIELLEAESVHAAEARVHRGDATAAVVIGPAFSSRAAQVTLIDLIDLPDRRLAGGLSSLDIAILSRATLPLTRAAVAQMVFSRASRVLVRDVVSRLPLVQVFIESQPGLAIEERKGQAAPETDPYFADLVPYRQVVYLALVPAHSVLFAFFLLTIMARSFSGERDAGTLLRLVAAPVGSAALTVGKTAPFYLLSVLQGVLLFMAGRFLFGMPWGDRPWLLPLVVACTSLSVTGLGLLLASWVRTESQAVSYGTFISLTLAAISGCLVPRDWMPDIMQRISLGTPHAWALMAYDELLSGNPPDLGRVYSACAMLVGFAALFFTAGLWRFRFWRNHQEMSLLT